MENRQVLAFLIAVLLCFPIAACEPRPTAIVIDVATGKPVEGAIALAQWYEAVSLGLGLGASEKLTKTKEVYADKDGSINIDDFWGWFSADGQLSVYKPGYVLWDSKHICPTLENRTDFDKDHRTVKLLKFDTEAARWLKEYPNRVGGQVGPRRRHMTFFSDCHRGSNKFQDIFDKYELPLVKKEEFEYVQKLKKSNEGLK